jgi:hypothetical protein
MRFVRTVLGGIVLALGITTATAQTGGITVKVENPDGTPMIGATVAISHPLNYVSAAADRTKADGIVEFPILKAGKGYVIEVSFPGYATFRLEDIHVQISDTTKIPVRMTGEFQEKVKVTAQRDVIDLEETAATTQFTDDFISDLPVPGRFYQNVLTLAPGVQDADGDGNPNVHGARDRDFQAQVSGISNVDPLTGQWMSRINPNSIEEMEVVTAGAGVEFGRAQGGFARIIQKQGSNELEGVFEMYYRSSKLDGDGAIDLSNVVDPDYDWYQPGFQLSGPVIKDKLWYRLSHEFFEIEDPVAFVGGGGVERQSSATHSDQLTWQISPRNKLAVQFQSDPLEIENDLIGPFRPSSAARRREITGETWGLTWTTPYSPKVLVETTVGWSDLNTGIFPNSEGIPNSCLTGSGVAFLENAQCFDSITSLISGSYNATFDDHRQRLTARSQSTFFGGRFWGMSHQFKLGLSIENERYFRDQEIRPFVNLFRLGGLDPDEGEGIEEEISVAVATIAIPQQDDVRATGTNWGIYGEDTFRPLQNLTMTLGVRVDREELNSEGRALIGVQNPSAEFATYRCLISPVPELGGPACGRAGLDPDQNYINVARSQAFSGYEDVAAFRAQITDGFCTGSADPGTCANALNGTIVTANVDAALLKRQARDIDISNTNVSPAFSFVWVPWSNNKTAIKGAVGRHYNHIPLIVPLTELEPARVSAVFNVVPDGTGGVDIAPRGSIQPSFSIQQVDRDLKTPFQDEITLAFEREIFTETRLTLRYINRQYKDQIQDRNINLMQGDFGECQLLNGSWQVRPISPDHPNYDPTTNPFHGDGVIDDCIGLVEYVTPRDEPGGGGPGGPPPQQVLQAPDGRPDLYVINPLWGDVFEIGNHNEIDYQAYVLEIIRRQYRSWEMQGSYTWSTAEGDGEDFFQEVGDDPSLLLDEFGYQAYDQRHVVKINATTITPWGIRLGGGVTWQSGLPYSIVRQEEVYDAIPPIFSAAPQDTSSTPAPRVRQRYLDGGRNDFRNEDYWTVDLKATREMNLGRGLNMQVSAEIFNLLDEPNPRVWNPFGEAGYIVNGNADLWYLTGRQRQLGLKLSF